MSLLPDATEPKLIVSDTASAFAATMASRSVHSVTSQAPVPGSATEFTLNVVALADATKVNIAANTRVVVRNRRPGRCGAWSISISCVEL
jgi:hypothetical protein